MTKCNSKIWGDTCNSTLIQRGRLGITFDACVHVCFQLNKISKCPVKNLYFLMCMTLGLRNFKNRFMAAEVLKTTAVINLMVIALTPSIQMLAA
jgi:hypothetical protein